MQRVVAKGTIQLETMLTAGDPAQRASALKLLLPFIRDVLEDKSESDLIVELRADLDGLMAEIRAELLPQHVDIPVDTPPEPEPEPEPESEPEGDT
jgi:hypothetical protein